MMKTLTIALAALLPASASAALSLAPGGQGQAVYVPYYTVNDGQSTLLTISNSSGSPKAVRINLVEALNGQRVFAMNVYLGGYDTWTAAISDDGNASGPAVLRTADASCATPSATGAGQQLGFAHADFADDGPQGPSRTRSGAIEIIELGAAQGDLASQIEAGECDAVLGRFEVGGAWDGDLNAGLVSPDGGLSASSLVIDGAQGVSYSLPGSAIEGFARLPHHTRPQSPKPRITDPVPAQDEVDFEVRIGDGSLAPLSVPVDRGAEAISALFMAASLWGDYSIDPALGASSAWLISFPTRHAHVNQFDGSLYDGEGLAAAPFAEVFTGGSACDQALLYTLDRQGEYAPVPSPPVPTQLCAQTQLLTFGPGGHDPILSGPNGRAMLDMSLYHTPIRIDSVELRGVPVVGFQLSRFVNENVTSGVLANYTVSEPLESNTDVDRLLR